MRGLDDIPLHDILTGAIGREMAGTAVEAFHRPASVSVRINPFKVHGPEAFAREHFGPDVRRIPWSPFGFMLGERPKFTLDPLFHCGCYYVQDSSAMVVGNIFRDMLPQFEDRSRPLRVLDLCAAPGGKSTDLAVSLRQAFGDGFILVSNEVMRSRASVLADNIAVWGDPNVVVTSVDPKAFARLEGFFDVIVADVPCSGEGMFRKDAKAVEDWSESVVNLCSTRQRRILADVWPALRRGGSLVYSTCTFEESENDGIIEWAAAELGGDVYEYDYADLPGVIPTRTGGLLVPGFVKGEGQFVSALVKSTGPERAGLPGIPAVGATERRKGNMLIHIPESIPREVAALDLLRPVRAGVAKGELKGQDLVPSADWALSLALPSGAYPVADLDRETALKFLHRDCIFLKDAPKGFVLVRFEGHPLGFVKNLGTRCNNLHPQGRKIKMDV